MKDRIKKFIDYKRVSAGELALRLDVQRSNISHILNGRNKPGASFIEKFLLEFPDLDARWLFTGAGEMTLSGAAKQGVMDWLKKEEPVKNNAVKQPNVIKQPPEKEEIKEEPHVTYVTQPKVVDKEKTVEKIVVFYSDKTFSAYKPE